MTNLADLFSIELFDEMVQDGYVRIQTHPTLPLSIANYAEKAQFEHVWNDVTLQCRGLIFTPDGTVVARPYRKFFNYGDDANTGPLDLDAPVVVTDKLDGSLGISYPTPDGLAIATRGSFASDQAIHATELLRAQWPNFHAEPGFTYLWEIIYPENRIVVDYGGADELVLHGVISMATGQVFPGTISWRGRVADRFDFSSLAEALAAPSRANREGLVVRYPHANDLMVKIKQADYVALHRIITGLNAKTVWEWLGDGRTVGDLCVTIPDEFHGWVEAVASELDAAATGLYESAVRHHQQLLRDLPIDHTRGDYARAAQEYPQTKSYLFMLLDGQHKRARELAWREVKPSGARSMVNHSEAVA